MPDISRSLGLAPARVSDEKYKALRKLERHLADRRDDLDIREDAGSAAFDRQVG